MPSEPSHLTLTPSAPTASPSLQPSADRTDRAHQALRQRVLMMLDELGVEPEPATEILLRQVEERAPAIRRRSERPAPNRASRL